MPRLTEPRPDEPIRIIHDSTGRPRYQVVVTVSPVGAPRRKQARRNFDSLRLARAFVDKARTEVREGDFQVRDSITLEQLGELWLLSKARPRESTKHGYAEDLRRALAGHGDRPVQAVTTRELQGWVNAWPRTGGIRGRGLSPRSIEIGIQRLRQVLAHGIRLGVIRTNPALDVEAPSMSLDDQQAAEGRKVDAEVWTFAQLQAFVRAVEDDPLEAGWRLSACGLRRSEVLGMDWGAVDLDGLVHVVQARAAHEVDRVKRDQTSRRTLDVELMVPGTRKVLRELWVSQGQPETGTARLDRLGKPYGGRRTGLLVTDAAGQPYDPDMYTRRFFEIAAGAGLPRIKLHAIRHTIATELHDRGVAPATAAALLGHTVETHLRVYVRSTAAQQRAAAEAFAGAWAGASGDTGVTSSRNKSGPRR